MTSYPTARRLPILVATVLLAVTVAPAVAAEIAEPLPEVLAAAAPDELVPVILVLERQVPREEIADLRARYVDRDVRRRAIVDRLKQEARRGQEPVLQWLATEESNGRVRNVRPLWITSVIGVEATPDVVRRLAAVAGIRAIRHNPEREVFLERPASGLDAAVGAGNESVEGFDTTAEIECGVGLMDAPGVWNTLGISGEGAVVAVIDSGVCYTHPDIANRIWVNPGEDLDGDGVVMDPDDENGVDDDGNGHVDDLIGWNFEFDTNDPDDNNSHGSHCAGTVAGDGTSGTQAGMAPTARIMVVRVGLSTSDEVDVWNGMQYAAENGADAISMSLGWQHSWSPDRATWRDNCENTIDMGTAMVIAAGNEGSGNDPDNVRTPGDVPRVITVGAVDCSDSIAGFSSRGPVTWQDVPAYGDHPYPPGLVKPDVSAPGVSTKSHNFCSGYSIKSGTSMATPHVAGAVALMVSANPTIGHDEIKQALMDTSIDLGAPGMDNVYGMGRVDAFAAVQAIATALRYVDHVVDDSDPAYGNGDGHPDLDEVVRIRVTLENAGSEPVTGIWARLTSENPSIEILDGVAYWPDIPVGGTAESTAPHFTVRFRQGCGGLAGLRLAMFSEGNDPSSASFGVRPGDRTPEDFFTDDLESDVGWTVAGTEAENGFVREDPNGVTAADGTVIQPEDDTTASGSLCWVTGNPRTNGKFNAGEGDVDQTAELISPVFDASASDELVVDLSRWVHIGGLSFGDTTHYRVDVSNDGGSTWQEAERLSTRDGSWDAATVPLNLAPSTTMRLRFVAAEEKPLGGLGDTLVEVAIDDVRVHGVRYYCDDFVPPAALAPNGVGASLVAGRTGEGGTRLDWAASPADAGHDPATFYHVHRSTSATGGFAEVAETTVPFHVEFDDENAAPLSFYTITASNGGGTSGDEPAP